MKNTIVVTGTELGEITLEIINTLKSAHRVVLHTERCGTAEWLRQNNIAFETLDELYDTIEDFDAHIEAAVKRVTETDGTVYCVLTAQDESAKRILSEHPDTKVIGANDADMLIRADKPVTVMSALRLEDAALSPLNSVLITEINTRVEASELKLKLMDIYGDDISVYVRQPNGSIAHCLLEDMDRLKSYDHRSACLINPAGGTYDFEALLRKARVGMQSDSTEDTDYLASQLVELVKGIAAGEPYGETTAAEVFNRAGEMMEDNVE